jgi:uncharacterized protein (DUF2267 family)
MASATYEHAVQRANVWVADVTSALGSQDRQYGQRVVRAWLHTLRDRLTIEAAVKLAQQLPELLRGIYYDGWEPHLVPVKYNTAEFVYRFSAEAFVPSSEVPGIAATVTRVFSDRMSPGQLAETLAELPNNLRALVRDGAPVAETGERARSEREAPPTVHERLDSITQAVLAIARSLEGTPQRSGAGRTVEEILIAGR